MKRLFAPLALLALLLPFAAGCEVPTGDAGLEEAAAPMSAEAKSALAALPAGASFLAVADAQALQDGGVFDGNHQRAFAGEAGARLKDFLDATGFDPAEDVRTIYAAVPPGQNAVPQLAVAADFDRARFQEQLDGELGNRFEKETYRGQPLYHSTREDGSFSFALAGGGLLLFAPRPGGVRQMMDRLETGASSIRDDEAAMRLADQVRERGDTWFVARGLRGGPFRMNADSTQQGRFGQIEKVIRNAAGAVSVSEQAADGELFLYTQDEAAPADLQEVLEGLVAALQKRDDLPADKRRALESVEIERSGEAVRVSFSLPMHRSNE